jgi:hypothetical protein
MFLFVVFLALMFLVGIYLVHHDLGTIGWAWLALSVALGIAVYEVPQLQARRAINKNPSARSDIVLNISDAGIDGVAATGNTQLLWKAYTKYKETEHAFLLDSDYGRRLFIPKRAMPPEQIQELRELLRTYLRNRKEST